MKNLKLLFSWVKNFIFPAECVLCGGCLIDASEIRYGLCEECRLSLPPIEKRRCNLCGKPLSSEKELCIPCRNGASHSYDRLWTLFPYRGKYRKLLTEYKFCKNTAIADFFIEKMFAVLQEPILQDAFIVPVPPRPGKIKHNGWDQVDYLAKKIAGFSQGKFFISRCLKRKKSQIQKRLRRTERMENLKGRIYAHKSLAKTVLVIDDVITTGSTMEVCCSALKEHGAQKVYGLCLFYD